MPPLPAFVLGMLLGLTIGAGIVVAVVRSVGRITGSDPRGVARLILSGLRPGGRTDGVVAQRAVARRLSRTGGRTASGRRVAASEVALHVSPEDFALIDEALGVERATADLAEFYRGLADRSGWLVQADPRIVLVRDISLRPRQVIARATTRAPRPGGDAPPVPSPRPSARAAPAAVPEAAVTDVLPAGLIAPAGPATTRTYPRDELAPPAAGDLLVVHGTDVRTVPAEQGILRIGRGAHNDLVVDRPGVARDHVVVERRGAEWWIVPGTSPEGTAVDGRTLERPVEIDGQALVALGRGVRIRLTVEPKRPEG